MKSQRSGIDGLEFRVCGSGFRDRVLGRGSAGFRRFFVRLRRHQTLHSSR